MSEDRDLSVGAKGRASESEEPAGPMVGHRHTTPRRPGEARRENWPGEGDLISVLDRGIPPLGQMTPVPSGRGTSDVSTRERDRPRRRWIDSGAAAPGGDPAGWPFRTGAGAPAGAGEPEGAEGFEDAEGAEEAPAARPGRGRRGGLGGLGPSALLGRLGRRPLRSRAEVVDPFGFDARYAAEVEPLLRFLYDRYFRVTLTGGDHLPARGRALLVANHSGTLPLDAAMIMEAVRRARPHRRLRPLVEDFVFHAPVLGPAIRRIGGVRAHRENGERLLGAGQLAAVFPEGIQGVSKPFRERYRLQRFGRGGFVRLALKTRSPIVPVAVVGAEETYPLLGKVRWLARPLGVPFFPVTPTFPLLGPAGALPLPAKWRILVGPPISVAEHYPAGEHDDRVLVHRIAEQVRATIQQMVDDAVQARRSVFRG